jgi:hypothetical protein
MAITTRQIDAIIPFLARFEDKCFSAGSFSGSSGEMPYFEYDEAVTEFETALYDNGWISSTFNWSEWQESAIGFVEDPTGIESADVSTIQKLLKTHVRKDRFCEGHLAAMFKNGHIAALLRRLKQVRQELEHQR